jgi:glutathione S-transferase
MEVPRMILAVSGKFPPVSYFCHLCFLLTFSLLPCPQNDYEDGRFSEIPDSFDGNLGRMPVMKIGDESIGQSSAINFYLASQANLMGASLMEAAKIISVEECLKDMNNSYRAIVPYGVQPTDENWDQWFTGGATDITGPALRDGQSSRYAYWYFSRIEQMLGSHGYAVGNQLSLADILIYNSFAEELKEEEAAGPQVAAWRYGPFGNKKRTDEMLEGFPKIKASIAQVKQNENIQKWLAMRGIQHF